jgi:hypothetical protein
MDEVVTSNLRDPLPLFCRKQDIVLKSKDPGVRVPRFKS